MIALRCHSGNHSRAAAKREEEAGPRLEAGVTVRTGERRAINPNRSVRAPIEPAEMGSRELRFSMMVLSRLETSARSQLLKAKQNMPKLAVPLQAIFVRIS